jgi:hypothetical protein
MSPVAGKLVDGRAKLGHDGGEDEALGTSSIMRSWPNARTTAAFIVFAKSHLPSVDSYA